MLYFITGNAHKFTEMQAILAKANIQIEQLDIDLTEIQDSDPEKVMAAKLAEARAQHNGSFIAEDTSLAFEGLNGLPGPLIKWFLKSLGVDGTSHLAQKLHTQAATAYTIIGYIDDSGNEHYFKGEVSGNIVEPRGDNGFGWDPIFEPTNSGKTLAEMKADQKNLISTRKIAASKLTTYLSNS